MQITNCGRSNLDANLLGAFPTLYVYDVFWSVFGIIGSELWKAHFPEIPQLLKLSSLCQAVRLNPVR